MVPSCEHNTEFKGEWAKCMTFGLPTHITCAHVPIFRRPVKHVQ